MIRFRPAGWRARRALPAAGGAGPACRGAAHHTDRLQPGLLGLLLDGVQHDAVRVHHDAVRVHHALRVHRAVRLPVPLVRGQLQPEAMPSVLFSRLVGDTSELDELPGRFVVS